MKRSHRLARPSIRMSGSCCPCKFPDLHYGKRGQWWEIDLACMDLPGRAKRFQESGQRGCRAFGTALDNGGGDKATTHKIAGFCQDAKLGDQLS